MTVRLLPGISVLCCAVLVGILSWTTGCSKGGPEPAGQAAAGSVAEPKVVEEAKTAASPQAAPKPQTTFFHQQTNSSAQPIGAPLIAPEASPPTAAPVAPPIAVAPDSSTTKAPAPGPRFRGGQDFSRPLVPLESPAGALPPPVDLTPGGRSTATGHSSELPPLLLGGDRAIVPAGTDGGLSGRSAANPLRGSMTDKETLGKKPGDALEPLGQAGKAVESRSSVASTSSAAVARVEKLDKNNPTLVIEAGWKTLTRPSIQIEVVTDPQADLSKLSPIPLNGAQALTLWEQQVAAINKPLFPNSRDLLKTSTAFLEYRGGQWVRVRSRTNSQGRPAAYAVEDKRGTGLAFYLLDAWADNQGAIRIALADLDVAPKYAEPGRLKVWLLSDDKVVGSATADWPGKPATAAVPGAENGKSGANLKLGSTKPAPTVAVPGPKAAAPDTQATAPAKVNTPPATVAAPSPTKTAEVQTPSAAKPTPNPVEPAKTPDKTASNAGAKPSAPSTSQTPADTGPKDIHAMSIDELTTHIERTYADQMNRSVRKAWLGGMRNYYQNENSESFRRDLFMTLLKACWKEQRQGDLRNAFAVLYQKLKSESQGGQASK